MPASLIVLIIIRAYVGAAVTRPRTAEQQMEQVCTGLLQCV